MEAKVALRDTNQSADPTVELGIARRRRRMLEFLGSGTKRAPLTPLFKLVRLENVRDGA